MDGLKKFIKRKKVTVCNAVNTSDYDIIDGKTCIEYWLDKRTLPVFCPVCHKQLKKEDAVGGHVINLFGKKHVFITPMHGACNSKKEKAAFFKVHEPDLVKIPKEDEQKILKDPENGRLLRLLINAIVSTMIRNHGDSKKLNKTNVYKITTKGNNPG